MRKMFPYIKSQYKNLNNVYDSIQHAANKLNVSVGAIKHVLAGRNKHCKGHTFQYIEVQ